MIGPAVGEPDPGRAAQARTGSRDAAGGILVLLALGLTFRLIIAYLLPGSGFKVDISSFQFWAQNLASDGLHGFYDRPFFHDYTPGYLYVLWLVGGIAHLFGSGVGDFIKLPPVLGDLALGYLVWSMTRELGGSERAARIGAALVLFIPVTWFDSVVWGQVDSFGVVFLLLALRELWRDRPERAAILATVAALIKPQLGILIPIVAIVVIRRALWPAHAYGEEGEPERGATTTGWEQRVRGPLRIVTTGLAGLLTAIALSFPFGLSFPGLVAQLFKTAAGYPYVSVNAYNPWALVNQAKPDGGLNGIAVNRQWVCDSTIVPTGPSEFHLGPIVIPEWSSAGSDLTCANGFMVGAFPAVTVGAGLFLIAAVIVLLLVARRPDRMTMLVGLSVLALAFFVLPTRVHERYLFPLVALGAILAGFSLRWRVAYLLAMAAMFANMYAVLTTLYGDNPRISDWLGIGQTLTSFNGVAVASLTQAIVLGWAFFQLRDDAIDDLAVAVRTSGHESTEDDWAGDDAAEPLRPVALPDEGVPWVESIPGQHVAQPGLAMASAAAGVGAPDVGVGGAIAPAVPTVLPAWDDTRDATALGPWSWFRARLGDRPARGDRSATLTGERGGRIDKLDLWILAVLAVSLLTVRMWRLPEPYQMHFDEVYHPRTATEFLQDWRYGISHDIYEWTHPHMAKYAMALGLVAFGEDKVGATSQLDIAVTDAAIEPRRDSGLNAGAVEGDRLWVATGSEVRAYDLSTREPAGTLPLPGAVAVAVDPSNHVLYVGTRSGEVRTVKLEELDATRYGVPQIVSEPYLDLHDPIEQLYVTRDGGRLAAVVHPTDTLGDDTRRDVAIVDIETAAELARPTMRGVTQLGSSQDGRVLVATADGVVIIDPITGEEQETVDIGGPVTGVVGINDIDNDPVYAAVMTPEGPRVAVIIAKGKDPARIDHTIELPGDSAGRAYYDHASRMVHVEGTVGQGAAIGPSAAPGTPTIYVIEPHGNAVYADSPLPYHPAAIVMDDNQEYPSTDRQELLALDAGGQVASVEIGMHAFAWRVPGVVAGVLMALLLYVLARLLFRRRAVAVILGFVVLADGMLFAQSRIGMNDAYVGLGIVAAYVLFAAIWRSPGRSRRHWLAFALVVPLIGLCLGFALASKWVAAYAIGGLGLLVLTRSALGRLLLIAGLVFLTTVLGYVAISVGEGQTGGNYLFLVIMVALTIIAAIVNVLHPIAWTDEELRFALGVPAALGALVVLYGLASGDPSAPLALGPITSTPIQLGLLGFAGSAVVYAVFFVAARVGFGPLALAPAPDDPAALLEAPAQAPEGWLRLGSGLGLPAVWLLIGLVVIPLGFYIAAYLPWAFVENHQIVTGWPPGHTGQTLLDLTGQMYNYHNNLSSAHPASSPWWAWPLDLKPVWFYEEGFAGGTSASIYDAGNLVAWWLSIPAMAFLAWQSFKRRSPALALIGIGFAVQWLSWARIDRAAFQYHYYTSLPFLFLALAYFLAELWHGPSRRTWLFARLSAGLAILGPFLLWLFHRPLCAIAQVDAVNPNSQACPTTIPEVDITARAVAIAVVVGVGVLLLLRELLLLSEEEAEGALPAMGRPSRWLRIGVIAAVTSVAFFGVSWLLGDTAGLPFTNLPVEPIALVVVLALTPVAAYVATARDSRRFVLGALGAIGFWFVIWYPNIAALPLPAPMHNAYQGFLPTYLYPFQFWVLQGTRAPAPPLLATGPAILLAALTFTVVVVAYSAWSWRVALAERRRDALAAQDGSQLPAGAD